MLLLALLVVGIMVRAVNSHKLRVRYSLIWAVVAAALLLVALFPGVVYWLCDLFGVETPSNLVYLCGIVLLILITFYQTLMISDLSGRVTRLTQIVSLEKFSVENYGKFPMKEAEKNFTGEEGKMNGGKEGKNHGEDQSVS